MELVFSKVVACNFALLHFVKQWGFCSFVHLQQVFRKQKYLSLGPFLTKLQAVGFDTNSSKIKFRLFQTNNYWILGINYKILGNVSATDTVVHNCSSKWPKMPATLLKRDSIDLYAILHILHQTMEKFHVEWIIVD